MPQFSRRDGESALGWVGRLHFADAFALTAADQDALHAQRGLAAAAVEAEEEQREAGAGAGAEVATESAALGGCKAAALALTPADQQALLSWLRSALRC